MAGFLANLWCYLGHRRSWIVRHEGDWSHVYCRRCPADRNLWSQPR